MEIRWTNDETDETTILFTECLKRLYREGDKVYAELKDGRIIFLEETEEAARYLRNIGMFMRLIQPETSVKSGKYEKIQRQRNNCGDDRAGL